MFGILRLLQQRLHRPNSRNDDDVVVIGNNTVRKKLGRPKRSRNKKLKALNSSISSKNKLVQNDSNNNLKSIQVILSESSSLDEEALTKDDTPAVEVVLTQNLRTPSMHPPNELERYFLSQFMTLFRDSKENSFISSPSQESEGMKVTAARIHGKLLETFNEDPNASQILDPLDHESDSNEVADSNIPQNIGMTNVFSLVNRGESPGLSNFSKYVNSPFMQLYKKRLIEESTEAQQFPQAKVLPEIQLSSNKVQHTTTDLGNGDSHNVINEHINNSATNEIMDETTIDREEPIPAEKVEDITTTKKARRNKKGYNKNKIKDTSSPKRKINIRPYTPKKKPKASATEPEQSKQQSDIVSDLNESTENHSAKEIEEGSFASRDVNREEANENLEGLDEDETRNLEEYISIVQVQLEKHNQARQSPRQREQKLKLIEELRRLLNALKKTGEEPPVVEDLPNEKPTEDIEMASSPSIKIESPGQQHLHLIDPVINDKEEQGVDDNGGNINEISHSIHNIIKEESNNNSIDIHINNETSIQNGNATKENITNDSINKDIHDNNGNIEQSVKSSVNNNSATKNSSNKKRTSTTILKNKTFVDKNANFNNTITTESVKGKKANIVEDLQNLGIDRSEYRVVDNRNDAKVNNSNPIFEKVKKLNGNFGGSTDNDIHNRIKHRSSIHSILNNNDDNDDDIHNDDRYTNGGAIQANTNNNINDNNNTMIVNEIVKQTTNISNNENSIPPHEHVDNRLPILWNYKIDKDKIREQMGLYQSMEIDDSDEYSADNDEDVHSIIDISNDDRGLPNSSKQMDDETEEETSSIASSERSLVLDMEDLGPDGDSLVESLDDIIMISSRHDDVDSSLLSSLDEGVREDDTDYENLGSTESPSDELLSEDNDDEEDDDFTL